MKTTKIPFIGLFIIILLLLSGTSMIYSQNVAITDDESHTADASAMLDIKSITKGMLVPRMMTEQRLAIGLPGTPAIGLLVYDTDLNNFFYYNGITWMGLPQVWTILYGVFYEK